MVTFERDAERPVQIACHGERRVGVVGVLPDMKDLTFPRPEKQDKDPDEEVISHLASQLELSKREVKYLLNERNYADI